MGEWKEYKLGDVAIFKNGKSRPATEGTVPIYGGNGILGYTNQFNSENEVVVIGRVGAYCGSVYFENKPIWISDNALFGLPKKGHDTRFLFYFLKNLKLNSFAEGSSHPLLTQSLLNSIDVQITDDIKEQKSIASILSSLDDKIDLLHRQNKTLEALAETLFRQWFVEEAEGWETKSLEKLCTITRGASPRPIIEYVINGTVPWIKIADATGSNTFFIDSTNEFIIKEGVSKSVKVSHGDLILSNSATCGLPYLVELEGCIHDGWLLFRNFREISKLFAFFFLKQINRELNNYADGSVQNNLNTGILKEYPVKVPPKDLVQKFDEEAGRFVDKIKRNVHQIRTLSRLRDTLLPKLMSGEVRV